MLMLRMRPLLVLAGVGAGLAVAMAMRTRPHRQSAQRRAAARLTIHRPPDVCFRALRAFETWPQLLPGLAAVREIAPGRHGWMATGAYGAVWETVLDEEPPTRLSWWSVPGSAIRVRGEVRITPAAGGRGSEVMLVLEPALPGMTTARHGMNPAREALRRLRMLVEAGEIATTAGQPSGRQRERVRPALRAAARRLADQPSADRDRVELTSELSFPASDAPASRAIG